VTATIRRPPATVCTPDTTCWKSTTCVPVPGSAWSRVTASAWTSAAVSPNAARLPSIHARATSAGAPAVGPLR
jgi:hypothetical protein